MMSSIGSTKDDGPREAVAREMKASVCKCLHSIPIVGKSLRIPPARSHSIVTFEHLNTMLQRFGLKVTG